MFKRLLKNIGFTFLLGAIFILFITPDIIKIINFIWPISILLILLSVSIIFYQMKKNKIPFFIFLTLFSFPTISMAAEKCLTPKQMLEDTFSSTDGGSGCWICDVVTLFIEAADRLASNFIDFLQKGGANSIIIKFLGLCLAFYILIKVGLIFFTFDAAGQKAKKMWQDIIRALLFSCIAAAVLIAPKRIMFDYLFSPIFEFTAGLSQAITSGVKDDKGNPIAGATGVTVPSCSYCTATTNNSTTSATSSVFSPTLKNSMLCIVCNNFNLMAPPTVIGQFLNCYGAIEAPWIDESFFGIRIYMPNLTYVLSGVIFIVCFFILSAVYGFKCVDVFIRISYIAVVFPFLIVAMIFPISRVYMKKGFEVLIGACYELFIISISIKITLALFYSMVFSAKDMPLIAKALNSDETKEGARTLMELFDGSTGATFMCIALTFFVIKSIGDLEGIGQQLSGVKGMSGSSGQVFQALYDSVAKPVDFVKDLKSINDDRMNRLLVTPLPKHLNRFEKKVFDNKNLSAKEKRIMYQAYQDKQTPIDPNLNPRQRRKEEKRRAIIARQANTIERKLRIKAVQERRRDPVKDKNGVPIKESRRHTATITNLIHTQNERAAALQPTIQEWAKKSNTRAKTNNRGVRDIVANEIDAMRQAGNKEGAERMLKSYRDRRSGEKGSDYRNLIAKKAQELRQAGKSEEAKQVLQNYKTSLKFVKEKTAYHFKPPKK